MLNFLQIIIFFSQKLIKLLDFPLKDKVFVLDVFEHFEVVEIFFGGGANGEILGFIELSDVCGFVDQVLLLFVNDFV